jgi:dihydroxy-acid dehydratase
MHLLDFAEKVKEGVQAAGLVGMRFNTIGVSDGISMGTDGMSFSLQSRDLIADSIETIMGAQWYDANISIPGCDKNMPGCVIAMGRLNRPSLMIYGGTIRAGHSDGKSSTSSPHSRATANFSPATSTIRAAGHRPPFAAPAPAPAAACTRPTRWRRPSKRWACRCPTAPPRRPKIRRSWRNACAGRRHPNLLELDLKPRDIMTRAAFENAMVLVSVLGGSTNAVLHLIAMARSVVPLNLTRRFPEGQRPHAACWPISSRAASM